MSRKLFALMVFLAIAATAAACTNEPEVPPPGLANPASEYCLGLGFTEETRENDLGQYGICIFPDGSE